MADYNPMAEQQRPAVCVLAYHAQGLDLQPVFCGLEEEGIPVEVQESQAAAGVTLAKQAAHMSPLNVGLGVNGVEGTLVLHHRDLPADQPLFVIRLHVAAAAELRRLGINAARLVKGEPLVLPDNELPQEPAGKNPDSVAGVSNELFEQMVQSIVAELTKA
jgi:hypothetical protein